MKPGGFGADMDLSSTWSEGDWEMDLRTFFSNATKDGYIYRSYEEARDLALLREKAVVRGLEDLFDSLLHLYLGTSQL
jgi:hypothetical protein